MVFIDLLWAYPSPYSEMAGFGGTHLRKSARNSRGSTTQKSRNAPQIIIRARNYRGRTKGTGVIRVDSSGDGLAALGPRDEVRTIEDRRRNPRKTGNPDGPSENAQIQGVQGRVRPITNDAPQFAQVL